MTTQIALALQMSLALLATATLGADEPKGHWSGSIDLPNTELGIAVTLDADAEGNWSGTIDIPAQGLRRFELSEVRAGDGEVHFEMAGIPGKPTFDGTVSESGDAISGTFSQGSQTLSFALEKSAEAPPPAAAFLPVEAVPGPGVVGNWVGELDTGPAKLRLALHVEKEGDETTAEIDSLDQGTKVPVATVEVEKPVVKLGLPAIGASFEGTMKTDGSAIEGTWEQGGRAFPLTFHRTAKKVTLVRPQEPKPPFPYGTRDVTFPNPAADLQLAGTFVVPAGEGPFPALVFVTGSGPQDRDEQLVGHRPFLVIADHLARHGIASLRFDDRGYGESEGDHMGSSVADFATDVEAALAHLIAQPEVDRDAVGILGHSEGGVSGPLAAVGDGEVDFLVLLAPPGVPLDQLLVRQTVDILRHQGVSERLIRLATGDLAIDLQLVRDTALDQERLEEKLRARVVETHEFYSPEELAALGADDAAIEQSIETITSAWFRTLTRIDPAIYLRQIQVPVLALFGGKDIQVAAQENAEALEIALERAGNSDFDVRVLPDLNHLLQLADTGGIEEYGEIEETISPGVLELIADWIRQRFVEH